MHQSSPPAITGDPRLGLNSASASPGHRLILRFAIWQRAQDHRLRASPGSVGPVCLRASRAGRLVGSPAAAPAAVGAAVSVAGIPFKGGAPAPRRLLNSRYACGSAVRPCRRGLPARPRVASTQLVGSVPRPLEQVPGLHGHRHRRHRRQVVQPVVLAGHAGRTAADSSKITVKYLLSTTTADYAPNITAFLGQKCGIIVTVGFLMAAATQTAAKANPSAEVRDRRLPVVPAPDQTCATRWSYNTVQDGYLGGYLAAGMTKTGKVATFGGRSSAPSPSTWTASGTASSTTTQQAPHQRPGAGLEREDPER